jgi:hypothetical protein
MRLMKRLWAAFPSLRQRQYGQGQLEPFTRERSVEVARDLAAFNPYAQGLLEALNTQVIGKGIKYAMEGDDAGLRARAQAWLDDWLDREDWPQREAEVYQRSKRDGEALLWFQGGGYRAIEPEFIRPPDGTIEWSEGVRCALGDIETPEEYGYDDGEFRDVLPAAEVFHLKSNVDRCVKRGVSDFAATAEVVADAWTTARNMAKTAARREGILYFVQHAVAEKEDVEDLIQSQLEDYRRPTITGRQGGDEPVSLKQGAGVEHIDKGQELVAPPNPEGAEASVQAINTALLAVARKYGFPTWMISGDASNNGFASALVAESPQARTIEREQTTFCRAMRSAVWRALEWAVAEGELPDDVLGLDLVVTAHSAVPRDRKGETERREKLHENKIISRRKWAEEEGYDHETMQAQLRQEAALEAPPAALPPPETPPSSMGDETSPLRMGDETSPRPPGPPGPGPGGNGNGRPPGSPPAAPPAQAGLPLAGSGAGRFGR